MTDPADERSDADLERRLRATFDQSVDELDARERSRLNQSRQRALEAAQRRLPVSGGGRWTTWAPLGAIAAGLLVAVVVWRMPGESQVPAIGQVDVAPAATTEDSPPEPLELLAASEDLELAAAADLDFYAWVELTTADAADGVG
jgi:hypothetical protein